MSKIDTIINLINYQKQHPRATKTQIAKGIGITPQYLSYCIGELNLLKEHLSVPLLEADQIRWVMSTLDQSNSYQKEIHQRLQGAISSFPYTGSLRRVHPNEKPPRGEFLIGEFIPSNNQSSDYLHPSLKFSLDRLCYDPLFWMDQCGEMEWQLATAIEPLEDFSTWVITLRTDLHWSDGKRIIQQDIIQTISESRLASLIEDIKTDGKNRLHIRLAKADSMFPRRLTSVPILPSHSSRPYYVTSGAYRLKSFRQNAIKFRLVHNPDYYQEKKGGIDWITIRRFKHLARATEALRSEKIDLITLDALQPPYQISHGLPMQPVFAFGEYYYLLLLNRHRELLKDEGNCRRLDESIDYRRINRYLHGGQLVNTNVIKAPLHSSLNLKIICPKEVSTMSYLANLVGESVGDPIITSIFVEQDVPQSVWEEADVLLARISFGVHYSRLSQYFHSQGRNNPFGYANPQVDALLSQLDDTTNVALREVIGRQIMSLLHEDYAMILLSPHFEYCCSPLKIQHDITPAGFTGLIQNMKHLVVERN